MKQAPARNWIALTALIVSLAIPESALASGVPDGDYEMRGTYVGVLLCADCPGVWTELKLVDNGPNTGSGSGTFELHERYTGGVHGGREIVTGGTWTTLKFVDFSTGTIKLAADSGQKPKTRYFFCDHGRSLRMLDPSGHEVQTPRQDQIVLQRVIPLPRREFGPLTEDQQNATSFGRVGDCFAIMLPSTQRDWQTKWHLAPTRTMQERTRFGGSSWQPGMFTFFILQAVAPGTEVLQFTNTDGATVRFSFEITSQSSSQSCL